MKHLLCFGLGYCAQRFVDKTFKKWDKITGTHRAFLKDKKYNHDIFCFDREKKLPSEVLQSATHLLVSIPPDEKGDLVLFHHKKDFIKNAKRIEWIGYFSTTGVYGNHFGNWVDETSVCLTKTERSLRRVSAEKSWLELFEKEGIPIHIFRLSGIYGPERNAIQQIISGKKNCIVKSDHLFSRIHRDDICALIMHSLENPTPGEIYNFSDDHPSCSHEVLQYAAQLLGYPPLQEISFDDFSFSSDYQKSFYLENKKVSNKKIKNLFNYNFIYESYKEGLLDCLMETKKNILNYF